MKRLAVILCLTLSMGVAHAQRSSSVRAVKMNVGRDARADLQLSTSVIDQRYSVESGSKLLRLTLNLTYSNTGDRPIMLDKKSSLVYRKLLSNSLKAASESKYEYDESSSFIDVRSMQNAGIRMEGTPEKEGFITLKPGESYSLKKDLILRLYDGTKETEDFLHPGTRFLQLRVATWYYFADPDTYREKWRDEGYLWSRDVTSEPMPLRVERSW